MTRYLLLLSLLTVPALAHGAPQTVYQPRVAVTEVYLSGNGRTLHWSVSTNLAPVRGQGRRGTCRTATLAIRATPQGRPGPTMSQQRVRVRACFAGQRWTYTGWHDLAYIAVTPGSAHVTFTLAGVRQRHLARVR